MERGLVDLADDSGRCVGGRTEGREASDQHEAVEDHREDGSVVLSGVRLGKEEKIDQGDSWCGDLSRT